MANSYCFGSNIPNFFLISRQRKLVLFKMFIINCFPIALIIVGCIRVNEVRKDNYGCGDQPLKGDPPDSGPFYSLLCVLMVSYAFELLVFPAIIANKITRLVRRGRYATKAKGERLEQCLGGLLKCISILCCNKQGGKELRNKGEMKDFASNLVSCVVAIGICGSGALRFFSMCLIGLVSDPDGIRKQ